MAICHLYINSIFFGQCSIFFGFPPDICDQHEILNRMMYLLKKFEKNFFLRFPGGHRGKKISKKMKGVFFVNQIRHFVQNSTLIQNIWFFSKNIGGQKMALSASLLCIKKMQHYIWKILFSILIIFKRKNISYSSSTVHL